MSAQPLDARMARLEGAYEQIDHRLADLRQDMDRQFASVDRRFDVLEQRFDVLEQRFSAIDQRFSAIDGRSSAIDGRFSAIDQRFMWLAGLVVGTWITTILTVLFHH